MSWAGIEEHDAVVERFRRSLACGRLATSYLFVGVPGIGKRRFALSLAQALLCETRTEQQLNPCQQCSSCQQVLGLAHPDVDVVARPTGRTVIPVELFIGDREHRAREGLCHRLALKPSSGRRRIAVIDDADWLNPEGANSLLKTLEEPPPKSLLILIGTSLQRQLPTIRSRCQIVRFQPLSDRFVAERIMAEGWADTIDDSRLLAELAAGSLDQARQFADPVLRQFVDESIQQWEKPQPDTIRIAGDVQSFVDSAGKEAPLRRERLRQVLQLLVRHFRQQIRHDVDSAKSVTAESPFESGQLEVACRRLERCLQAMREVDANANLATLIECWVDDLGQALFDRQSSGVSRSVSGPR